MSLLKYEQRRSQIGRRIPIICLVKWLDVILSVTMQVIVDSIIFDIRSDHIIYMGEKEARKQFTVVFGAHYSATVENICNVVLVT